MHPTIETSETNAVVLFADVAGSTQLYEHLGDSEALKLVQQCLDLMRSVAFRFGGKVLKTIGDEVMCIFPESAAALYAAAEMQSQVRELPRSDTQHCALRIGFHLGPVVTQDNDAFGATVNIASRITRLAKGGQILTSAALVRELPPQLRMAVRVLNGMALKTRNEDIGVCEILWDFDMDMTVVKHVTATDLRPAKKLILRIGERDLPCDGSNITFGRDAASTVQLNGLRTSRHHARIEPRGNRFVLIDLSTNGTYVRTRDESALRLLREEFVLRGEGTISFGDAADTNGVESVHFIVK